MDRVIVALASMAGLAGVALAARAAHGPGGPLLDTAARFLLVHAAVLLALAALCGGTVAPRLGTAESYVVYRVRIELDRAEDRQEGFVRAREVLARVEDSPERQEALRLLADRLDLPRETLAGLEAGLQRERDLLAAVVRNPSLVPELAALTPDHFDDELHRCFRDLLVSGGSEDETLVALRAELVARADRDEIDERTGKELLLRLHERRLRRDLQGADLVRATELQARLAKVHSALAEIV